MERTDVLPCYELVRRYGNNSRWTGEVVLPNIFPSHSSRKEPSTRVVSLELTSSLGRIGDLLASTTINLGNPEDPFSTSSFLLTERRQNMGLRSLSYEFQNPLTGKIETYKKPSPMIHLPFETPIDWVTLVRRDMIDENRIIVYDEAFTEDLTFFDIMGKISESIKTNPQNPNVDPEGLT